MVVMDVSWWANVRAMGLRQRYYDQHFGLSWVRLGLGSSKKRSSPWMFADWSGFYANSRSRIDLQWLKAECHRFLLVEFTLYYKVYEYSWRVRDYVIHCDSYDKGTVAFQKSIWESCETESEWWKMIAVRISGRRACFTRPENKVERMTYPVITPSAAQGP